MHCRTRHHPRTVWLLEQQLPCQLQEQQLAHCSGSMLLLLLGVLLLAQLTAPRQQQALPIKGLKETQVSPGVPSRRRLPVRLPKEGSPAALLLAWLDLAMVFRCPFASHLPGSIQAKHLFVLSNQEAGSGSGDYQAEATVVQRIIYSDRQNMPLGLLCARIRYGLSQVIHMQNAGQCSYPPRPHLPQSASAPAWNIKSTNVYLLACVYAALMCQPSACLQESNFKGGPEAAFGAGSSSYLQSDPQASHIYDFRCVPRHCIFQHLRNSLITDAHFCNSSFHLVDACRGCYVLVLQQIHSAMKSICVIHMIYCTGKLSIPCQLWPGQQPAWQGSSRCISCRSNSWGTTEAVCSCCSGRYTC